MRSIGDPQTVAAGRYERSEHRRTERNGHRGRLLATQAEGVDCVSRAERPASRDLC